MLFELAIFIAVLVLVTALVIVRRARKLAEGSALNRPRQVEPVEYTGPLYTLRGREIAQPIRRAV